MARKLSTGAANYLATEGSLAEMHEGGVLMFFSGTQPANADAAFTGSTPLVAFTASSGVLTKEVRATAVIDLTSTTGNITVLTIFGTTAPISLISGTVAWVDTAANLAIALAANINAYRTYPNFTATVSGNKVTITAPKNSGAKLNGSPIVITVAAGSAAINGAGADTLGAAGGADGQVVGVTQANGLTHATAASGGSIAKNGVWSGVGGSAAINTALGTAGFSGFTTTGTASWFRFYGSHNDPELTGVGTLDSSGQYIRIDGSVATSGGDLTATGGTTITAGATHTCNTYTLAVPMSQ